MTNYFFEISPIFVILKLETSTTTQMKGIELLFPKNTNLAGPVYTEKKLQPAENCKKCENRKSASTETPVKLQKQYFAPKTFIISNNNILGYLITKFGVV